MVVVYNWTSAFTLPRPSRALALVSALLAAILPCLWLLVSANRDPIEDVSLSYPVDTVAAAWTWVKRQSPLWLPPAPLDLNWTVVVIVSHGFHEMLMNWLFHFRRLETGMQLFIVCEDLASYERLQHLQDAEVVSTNALPATLAGSLDFQSAGFGALVMWRPRRLLWVLECRHQLIYSDIDVVWRQDPRPHFKGDGDVWQLVDGELNGSRSSNLCTGFIAFRRTAASLLLLRTWQLLLEDQEQHHSKPLHNDQPPFNEAAESVERVQQQEAPQVAPREALELPHLRLVRLPWDTFPAGWLYWGMAAEPWRNYSGQPGMGLRERRQVVVVHNNWVAGLRRKVLRFKRAGLWHPQEAEHWGQRPAVAASAEAGAADALESLGHGGLAKQCHRSALCPRLLALQGSSLQACAADKAVAEALQDPSCRLLLLTAPASAGGSSASSSVTATAAAATPEEPPRVCGLLPWQPPTPTPPAPWQQQQLEVPPAAWRCPWGSSWQSQRQSAGFFLGDGLLRRHSRGCRVCGPWEHWAERFVQSLWTWGGPLGGPGPGPGPAAAAEKPQGRCDVCGPSGRWAAALLGQTVLLLSRWTELELQRLLTPEALSSASPSAPPSPPPAASRDLCWFGDFELKALSFPANTTWRQDELDSASERIQHSGHFDLVIVAEDHWATHLLPLLNNLPFCPSILDFGWAFWAFVGRTP